MNEGKVIEAFGQQESAKEEARVPEGISRTIGIVFQLYQVLNARLLALIALIGSLAMFGFTMYDPTTQRIIGASLYSIGVLWPIMWHAGKKG